MDKTSLIHTNGRVLYAEMSGQGSPTIVIEVGSTSAGTQDAGWQPIRAQLADRQSVVMYDRANLGNSGPARIPRSLDDFSADLQAVLVGLGSLPPYLLVGCSFGGQIVIHFASLHPELTRGVVLLDSPHPEVDLRTLAILPPLSEGGPQSLADFRRITWQKLYAPLETVEMEGQDSLGSIDRARSVWNLGNIPLAVLTAGINDWEPDFPPKTAQAYEAIWLELQAAYAALSRRSRHWIVADASHSIHEQRPDLVLEAIQWVMTESTL